MPTDQTNLRKFSLLLLIRDPDVVGYSEQDGSKIEATLKKTAAVTLTKTERLKNLLVFTFDTEPAEISAAKIDLVKSFHAVRAFIAAAGLGGNGKLDFDFRQFA